MFPLRSPGIVAVALTYAAISLISTQVPLLNYLGYELSAVIGLVGAVASGLLTIHIVKPQYCSAGEKGKTTTSHVLSSFRRAVALNMTLLAIPLVVMLANALFVKNCSFVLGFAFFLLIPVVSVWFGSALGFLCAVHYRLSKLVFIFYCLAFLIYSAAMGYLTPAIFSYNFLYGFFPGLTYDEALGLSWTLVIFRLVTVFVAAILIWLATAIVNRHAPTDSFWTKGISLLRFLSDRKQRFGSAAIGFVLASAWFFRCELGFESTSRFIQSKLGSTFSTEHFTIYYSGNSYDENEIKWIAAEHEFRLKQIGDAFYAPFHGKIESYIYPSNEVKQRFIGTGTTNIAKPWSGQIHTTRQSLDGTLKHELVHIVAAPFGLPVIRASLSTGLIEGLAMAIEWEWGNRTPHQYAAAMRRFGVMPEIEPMMLLTGFASQAASVSYVVCGSFCRFLIDRYGMRKMMQVYRTGDFDFTYGRSLRQLINEWHGFLDRIEVRACDRDAVDVLFRRPPIFRKVCARVVAERNIEAGKKYGQRDYKAAELLFGESYTEGKSYDALSGYLSSALRSGNATMVSALYDSITVRESRPSPYLPLFLTIGDAFWTLGRSEKAQELYSCLRQADLSRTLNELATLRLLAAHNPSDGRSMLTYMMSDANDSVRLGMLDTALKERPDFWMPKYLKGRYLLSKKKFEESFGILSSIELSSEDSSIEAHRLRMLGYDLFHLKRFQEAKSAFWNSLNYLSTEVAANEVNDWLERCEWMEKNNLR
ncbi:MAG TPA: hypothetical protein DGH68_09375 [Bacteroidetes bacterium]|nr:hypothetical protein [Bacteroidota bacterium]